jgi:hypothetical protein
MLSRLVKTLRLFGTLTHPLLVLAGCTNHAPVSAPKAAAPLRETITLYDRPLQIYLSKPKQVLSGQPLILYATGDGGWRGSDRAVFEQM